MAEKPRSAHRTAVCLTALAMVAAAVVHAAPVTEQPATGKSRVVRTLQPVKAANTNVHKGPVSPYERAYIQRAQSGPASAGRPNGYTRAPASAATQPH